MEKVCAVSHCASAWPGKYQPGFSSKILLLTVAVWSVCCAELSYASSVVLGKTELFLVTEISPTAVLHTSATSVSLEITQSSDLYEHVVTTESSPQNSLTGFLHGSSAYEQPTDGTSLSSNQVANIKDSDVLLSSSEGGFESSVLSLVSEPSHASPQTPFIEESTNSPSLYFLTTTDFLDSVAVSVRWNPREDASEIILTQSFVTSLAERDVHSEVPTISHHATTSTFNSATLLTLLSVGSSSVLTSSGSSEESSAAVSQSHRSSDNIFESEVTVTPVVHLSSDMVEINVTSPSAFTEFMTPSTSPLTAASSTSGLPVTSHAPAAGNESCAHDSGCREYQGDESDQDLQMTVIIGVVCGVVALIAVVGVVIGCMCRRRGKMSSGSKVDLSSYWDDSVTLSYINGHIDIPKDSADEMISLDNDSFLNSLDSISFTNTWTSDSTKHTIF